MNRGGNRQGAGRKPGVPNRVSQEVRAKARAGGETPLEYMLRVMRDESADPDRRDDMAKTVAPYIHGKMGNGGDADTSIISLLTGTRQSLATKLDRITRTTAASRSEDTDG